MSDPLYQLGPYQFSLTTAAPDTLAWEAEYRWEAMDRLGREPAYQWIGPGDQKITLSGVVFPALLGAGAAQIEELRAIAAQGKPLMFTSGRGLVLGRWVLLSISEDQSALMRHGIPRKQGFSLSLAKYGEDNASAPLARDTGAARRSLLPSTAPPPVQIQAAPPSPLQQAIAQVPAPAAAVAQAAGFTPGQMGGVLQAGVHPLQLGPLLGLFGGTAPTIAQARGWAGAGISAPALAQEWASGKAPPAMAIALRALGELPNNLLAEVVSGIAGEGEALLRPILQHWETIATILAIDPRDGLAAAQRIQLEARS